MSNKLPEKIGSYNIITEIGRGSYSTVYLAQTDSSQEIALKVLNPPAVRDPEQIERFRREAETIVQFDHPNIIRIHDTVFDEETLFIAMEYIPGGNLRAYLRSGRLERDEAVHIVKLIGKALEYAHTHPSRQIIHRDLKPENILLDTRQGLVQPVLTDFGSAKSLMIDNMPPLTETGSLIGTRHYMAPEQWEGEQLTPATDLYALAIIFFEMLAGERPFEAESPMALMQKHINDPLPLLSGIIPMVGPFFDDVLKEATAKKPSDRFRSVTDFIQAVETANAKAKQDEQRARLVSEIVKATEADLENYNHDLEKVLPRLEAALEMYPQHREALRLRGKLKLKLGRFSEALEDHKQAYDKDRSRLSDAGLDYCKALIHVADICWQKQQHQEAVAHCEIIRQILLSEWKYNEEDKDRPAGELWQKAKDYLINYHYGEGDKAYASGSPKNIDDAMKILDREAQILVNLKASSDAESLKNKKKSLLTRKLESQIELEAQAIEELNQQRNTLNLEGIIRHYQKISDLYQELIGFTQDYHRKREQHRNLRELIRARLALASRLLNRREPNYEEAIRQYNAINDLEKTGFKEVVSEFGVIPQNEINDLNEKANYAVQYAEIEILIRSSQFLKAKEKLEEKFIKPGNYYRKSLSLYEVVLYALEHDDNLPPDWQDEYQTEALNRRLLVVFRKQIEDINKDLDNWINVQETVKDEKCLLSTYEIELRISHLY